MSARRAISAWVAGLALCAIAGLGAYAWPELAFELGYAYEQGDFHGWQAGFARNHSRAALWLQRAARAGHPRAQYRLGILRAHGWGLPADQAEALALFLRSAASGYAPACYHLGWMYQKGDGVPQDQLRGRGLLRRAADQGMAAAHLALGRLSERGDGLPADALLALGHYAMALHLARSQPQHFDNAAHAAAAAKAQAALAARGLGPTAE